MKVKFLPQNIELEIKPNQTVLSLAKENGVFIKSICGGIPSCCECRVKIIDGEHNVIPPSSRELNLIGTLYYIDNRRLACQLRCFGDITVDISEQIAKQNKNVKRPQGSKENSNYNSQAIMGNFLLQEKQNLADMMEKKANEVVEEELKNQALKKIRNKKSDKYK